MIRLVIVLLFLVIFLVLSLPVLLILLILEQFNKDAAHKVGFWVATHALAVVRFLAGAKVTVNGLENIPKDQAALFVGDHISNFDAVVTYPLMIGRAGFVSKKEMKKIPILSWWMHFSDCIFLDREDPRNGLKMVLKAADSLKSGISIVLFPEGTRSRTDKVLPFKEGGFKIATKAKAPVVPFGISGTDDILEKHMPFIKSSKVTINIGKPIYTAEMSRAEQKELCSMVYDQVVALSGREKTE